MHTSLHAYPTTAATRRSSAEYATAAKDPEQWARFAATYLSGDEAAYQSAVAALRAEASA